MTPQLMQTTETTSSKTGKSITCLACGNCFSSNNNFCGQCGQAANRLNVDTNAEIETAALQHLGRRYVSALFSDIVRSTHLVRHLDPEQFERIMRLYQTVCGQVVADFGGKVIEDLGDGIVALFAGRENATESAVRAGDELVNSINELRAFESRVGALKLEIRVGIASGEALVKNDAANFSQRILGQPPYLAARLQALASEGQVLVCPETHVKTKGLFAFSKVPEKQLKIKGFDDIRDIWQVNAPNEYDFRFDASKRINLTPLAGREELMSSLLTRWERTTQSQGQLVIVKGAPGIGKSRVLAELQRRVKRHSPNVTMLRYQCSAFAKDSPLFPVMMQISRLSSIKKDDSAEIIKQKLNKLLEAWGVKTTFFSSVLLPLVLETNRRNTKQELSQKQIDYALRAVTQIQLQFSDRTPLLVIIEDAHWADDTSNRLIENSIKNVESRQMMIVASYRTNEIEIPEYDAHYASDFLLKRLSKQTAAELLNSINIGTPLAQKAKQSILDKCAGVPLFLEELTLNAIREANSNGENTHLKTPASLFDLFIQQYDSFDPTVKAVAQLASVIGQEFDLSVITPILGLSKTQSTRAVSVLIEREQIYQLEKDASWYQFKHALIRDAIYDNTLNQDKHRLHKAVHEYLSNHDSLRSTVVVRRIKRHKKMMKQYASYAQFH